MKKEPIARPFADPAVTERIRKLVRQLRMLHERINRIEEFAYTILALLEELIEEVERNHAPAPVESAGRATRSAHDRARLQRMAEAGVTSLKIERHTDGSATVHIDHSEPFELPPMLANLLEVLCRDGGRADDDLVGWKRREEVRVLLSKREDREITDHALTNAVYRLRSDLESRGGVNPCLLQTTRRDGLRFALLRSGNGSGAKPE